MPLYKYRVFLKRKLIVCANFSRWYGYDPGEFVLIPVEDEKIMAKLDWQITEDHRASMPITSTTVTLFASRMATQTNTNFPITTTRSAAIESYVLSLYSDWTDNFSTEIRWGQSEFEQTVTPLGGTDFGGTNYHKL